MIRRRDRSKSPVERLTMLYVLALSTVAVLSVTGQFVVQHAISTQSGDARVINVAGRQRMLSQRLTKAALAIERTANAEPRHRLAAELTLTLNLWERSHRALQNRSGDLGGGVNNTAKVTGLFEAIETPFENMKRAAEAIVDRVGAANPDRPAISREVDRLLSNEGAFLTGMDTIVLQYEIEATRRLSTLRTVELSLLTLTLTVLLIEGLFVFRPITRHIQIAFDRIRAAEQRETALAQELETILDSAPALIWYQDVGGNIIRVNKAAAETFGSSLARLGDTSVYAQFGAAGPRLAEDDRRALETGCSPADRHITIATPEAKTLSLRVQKVLRFDGKGRVIGAIALAEDVTEAHELERQLVGIRREEQRRIGQDLHDGLGQILTGILYLARTTRNRLSAQQPADAQSLDEITRLVKQSIQRVRELSKGLRPLDDGPENFSAALEALAAETKRLAGVDCSCECAGIASQPDSVTSEHLYRIAQEAVSNAVRHSECRQITIGLQQNGGALILTVSDDGTGARIGNRPSEGLGLRIMRRRAELLGATLELTSDRGTTVCCRLHSLNGPIAQ